MKLWRQLFPRKTYLANLRQAYAYGLLEPETKARIKTIMELDLIPTWMPEETWALYLPNIPAYGEGQTGL